jgi:hypothetical protein
MVNLPKISLVAFWDVKIDLNSGTELEEYSRYIIGKVFDYGTFNDILEVLRFYGKTRVKKEVTELNLKNKTISFCCALFNLKKTDFKCYRKKQLIPQRWNY